MSQMHGRKECLNIWIIFLVQWLLSYAQDDYSYLHHDNLTVLNNGEYTGNIAVVSSSNCPSTAAWNSLTVFDESKICISYAYFPSLNGEYNPSKNPFITNAGYHRYYIYDDETNENKARCIINNPSSGYKFDITHCIGRWEVYYNNQWHLDINMTTTPCSDICIHGINGKEFIPEGRQFTFFQFNQSTRTNIYHCKKCSNSVYLYGWIYDDGKINWRIGSDYNSPNASVKCVVGNKKPDNYIFDINDCLRAGSWKTWKKNKWLDNDDMMATKCNEKPTEEICTKMSAISELNKIYTMNGSSYQDFAVGIDLNFVSTDKKSRFVMEYSCGNVSDIVDFNSQTGSITDILYSLSKECDNSSSISITFIVENSNHQNVMSENAYYAGNLYLYHGVGNVLFFDDMENEGNWKVTSETAIAGYKSREYCPSNGKCWRLYRSKRDPDYVYIRNAITVNPNRYRYMDLSLEWSLKTTGLTNDGDALFNVEVQCDELCIGGLVLKQYDATNDCTNNSCNIQTYNLQSECDFASEIIIKLYLQGGTIQPDVYIQGTWQPDNIFIDYVRLTHSDGVGNKSPECILSKTKLLLTKTIIICIVLSILGGCTCCICLFLCRKKKLNKKGYGYIQVKPSAPVENEDGCPICMNGPKSHAAACGHRYCETCIVEIEKCAICRQAIDIRIALY